ncbi:hypothetical protein Patl1_32730 [Pistacia atlantica]|uniref:Uncharacterized protein n=1 Tax=Pistacia atlantica TaxID=434234 RepID=A0ACC1AQ65_9ROSI|nr:hypothetical protein Patl1_32730 [Pistacia atlantica]
MSQRFLGANFTFFSSKHFFSFLAAPTTVQRLSIPTSITFTMSYRPNNQGGRRGASSSSSGRHGGGGCGGRRGGGGRGGRRGGGRGGEQRWWDPVWRAERLRQQAAEMETLDENEWWGKMEQMKSAEEQEMIIKHNFSRADQQTLSDMAYQLGLYFHAYNKGKALVVSKVPLPMYRADLDERHGSTQKEIKMSTEIERRVGSLLNSSQGTVTVNNSGVASDQGGKQVSLNVKIANPVSVADTDANKEKLNFELKERTGETDGTCAILVFSSDDFFLPSSCHIRLNL